MADMSPYERNAWRHLTDFEERKKKRITSKVAQWTGNKADNAQRYLRQRSSAFDKVMDGTDAALAKAMGGLYKAILLPVISTVNVEGRLRRARRAGLRAATAQELRRENDLELLDNGAPRRRYTVALAAESVASSLAITGAQVSTTVSGGTTAGVAVGAVALDASTTLAALARAVAEVAAHYGYDPRLPEEERYLLAILNFSTASTQTSKTAALTGLSRLTQQMMRNPTWSQLERDVLVRVIQRIFKALGFRLVRRKLAQAVPVAGALINGGLAVALMEDAVGSAMRVYRLRLLTEKYGLDANEWTARSDISDVGDLDEEIIDVEVLPEDEINRE